jgi:hypothetical protein
MAACLSVEARDFLKEIIDSLQVFATWDLYTRYECILKKTRHAGIGKERATQDERDQAMQSVILMTAVTFIIIAIKCFEDRTAFERTMPVT